MAKASKATGTAVLDIKAELKKRAEGIKDRIQAPSGDSIRVTQDKKFKLPNGQEGPGPLALVILDFICVNTFFDRPYKEGDILPPACMALGQNPKTLVPEAVSPVKQADSCAECPNNVFGSDGAGKACKNLRLLAVVEDNDNPDSPIYLLKVSPTAIKAFDGYVATIQTQFDSLPVSVVTDVYFDPNLKYGSLRFGNPRPNPNLAIHFDRIAAATARLGVIPDVSTYTPPPKSGKKK